MRNREKDRAKLKKNNQKIGYLTSMGFRKYKNTNK